jgi:hypothetical protein
VTDFTVYQGTSIRPPRPRLWLYTCGSQDCWEEGEEQEELLEQLADDVDPIRTATSSVDDDDDEEPEWPLAKGTYKTVLIREQYTKDEYEDNYQVEYHYYESEPFQIVETPCHDLAPQQRRFLRRRQESHKNRLFGDITTMAVRFAGKRTN